MNATMPVRTDRRTAIVDDLEQVLEMMHVESLHQLSDRLQPHNLTISQYLALTFIAAQDRPKTLTEIGAHIDAPPSSMTGIIDRMVQSDYVVREQHPGDRRSFRVSITERGQSLLGQLQQQRREDFDFLLDEISDEQLEQFAAMFHQLQGRMAILLKESRKP